MTQVNANIFSCISTEQKLAISVPRWLSELTHSLTYLFTYLFTYTMEQSPA
jgi:hypothetical protein